MARDDLLVSKQKLRSGPLLYEPTNEQGVVAIFAAVCEEKLGIRIEVIRTGYPDCIGVKRGKRIKIEFEFESSRFNHPVKGCDRIVCWVDNASSDAYWRKRLQVDELRPLFPELGSNVWIQPYKPKNAERLMAGGKVFDDWTVPSRARKGDLLLIYRSGKAAAITGVMELATDAEFDEEHDWGSGFSARLRKVFVLPNSVPRHALRKTQATSKISFVRSPTPLGQNVLDHWPALLRVMLDHNPRAGLRKAVDRFQIGSRH
jgi:hypothetical protein